MNEEYFNMKSELNDEIEKDHLFLLGKLLDMRVKI